MKAFGLFNNYILGVVCSLAIHSAALSYEGSQVDLHPSITHPKRSAPSESLNMCSDAKWSREAAKYVSQLCLARRTVKEEKLLHKCLFVGSRDEEQYEALFCFTRRGVIIWFAFSSGSKAFWVNFTRFSVKVQQYNATKWIFIQITRLNCNFR